MSSGKKVFLGGSMKFKKGPEIKKLIHKPEIQPKIKSPYRYLLRNKIEEDEACPILKEIVAGAHPTKNQVLFQDHLNERMDGRIEKKLRKTHRQKIDEFNKKLGKMSEFNDIPNVKAM